MADQETRLRWASRCFAFTVTISVCRGFNLDPKFSVIKLGPAGSYFGYSVAEHQIVNDDESVRESLLLVGAPKEKVPVPSDTRTSGGAIYKCDATTTLEYCERFDTEPFVNRPQATEVVEDQWLGVALNSFGKGKPVVTCAHRYMRANAGLGICYSFLQTLDYQGAWIPCMGYPHTNFLEDFGLCQAGLSATIGEDHSMVIGAPGSIFWRGVIFQNNISDEMGIDKKYFMSPIPVDPSEEGANTAQAPPTDKYSYLGYSVTTGRFDAKRTLYFVSGSPRSHEKGEVVFFRKEERNSFLRYEPEEKLQGVLDFSGFGSSLLAVDLNNDGFDELIVGAPYYYDKGRGGAIYIYPGGITMINANTPYTVILSREMTDAECVKLGCEHGRFGMSLTKLGDVNKDGYQDFAVGAPFEGNGTVYIYHGSKNGVVKKYAQQIKASDMPNGDRMKSFGHSLSGGLDLDDNGYPDLLVGSYESNMVALIRSRAVIRLMPEIMATPNMTDLGAVAACPFDNSQRRCVQLEICLTFTAEPTKSFNSQPRITYRIDAEKSRSFSRLEMVNSADSSKKFVVGSVLLNQQGTGSKACVKELAYLKDVFADKLNPMELTLSFSLNEHEYTRPQPGQPLTAINEYPILSTHGSAGDSHNTVSVMVDFVKECGEDNLCLSNLQFEAILEDAPLKNGRYELQGGGEDSRAAMAFTITNLGEAAYLTRIYIQKPSGLDYQGGGGKGQDSDVKCLPDEEDDTLIVCDDIGNPLKTSSSITFKVKMTNKLAATQSKQLNITVWVNTSSTETTPENDVKVFPFVVIQRADLKLDVNVRPDDQILCSGEPRGASAMTTEEDIGTAVNHTYIVTNRGPSNVSRSTLVIEWPFEDRQGKYLLYLMEKPIIEKGVAVCKIDDNDVNPLQITTVAPEAAAVQVDFQPLDEQGSAAGARRKREAESRVRRAQGGGIVVLGCKGKTATCRMIVCTLGNLQGGRGYVQITLRARLWESTLLSDYRKAGDVQISSFGYVQIDPLLQIEQDTSDDSREAVTYAVPDFKDAGAAEVKWWVILLAVLGGILLLIIIIFVLYKVGFFKRKRPEEMQMYQAEKKQQKMLEDYEDENA